MTGYLLSFIFVLLILFSSARCDREDSIRLRDYAQIQDGFLNLADSNRLWCYYYWINDDISREGVTRDLEAMKEVGIGTALIGNINPSGVDGRVPIFSDEWWEVMVHAVNEGHRLGIDIGFFNCPGWSQSGGPWVTHEKAMRHLVYSEAAASGPGTLTLQFETPAAEFQDTYVLAFQSIQAEANNVILENALTTSPQASTSRGTVPVYSFEVEGNKAIEARSILLTPVEVPFRTECKLYAGKGNAEILVRSFTFDRSNSSLRVGPIAFAPLAISIPPVKASKFRLVCSQLQGSNGTAGFSEIRISEAPVLEEYVEKSLGKMCPTPFPGFDTYIWDEQEGIEVPGLVVDEVLDISDCMDTEGRLVWEAPEGDWTILRLGMAPTGTRNAPAAPQGTGYEIDKANAELVRFHFDHFIGEILDRVPQESRPAFKYVIADSYEMGSQNWTDGFAEKFESTYGYDPVRFLPVFSGRIVGSVEESERFLWDLRRKVADDVAYEYVGGLRKVSNENNLKLWLENYGHWGFPSEFLMYGGQSDLVSGEFWNEGELGNIECKAASSATHMYGKKRTSAEAFTASRNAYLRHPALLKKRGDWCFTEGINHIVLHLYIQQPDEKRTPGVNAWFSTEFNRHNTWFRQSKHWMDYLRRCQHLLQQGNYTADVLYFIGEDVPKMTGIQDPRLPAGYSFDYINAEVIMQRLSVKDGRYQLPDGMSYSLLVLPQNANMRPELLVKLEELVRAGGVLLGERPARSPSLNNYPACDEELRQIAERMWRGVHDSVKMKNPLGKGFVLTGMDLEEALGFMDVARDLDMDSELPVLWTHRTMPGMDIYFITNQSDKTLSFTPSFRVSGLKPQLWDAVTGEIRRLKDFSFEEGRTKVPLELLPFRSYFLVFSNQSTERTGSGYEENFPGLDTLMIIEGVWKVNFHNKTIGPTEPIAMAPLVDWTASGDNRMKYYSGTATYRTTFDITDLPVGKEVLLNLGKVGVMAEARLNGTDLGGTWMAPFRLKITGLLQEGENTLEVDVVNLWRNRIVGDLNMPGSRGSTWVSVHDAKAGEELLPSGLMGPVMIEVIP